MSKPDDQKKLEYWATRCDVLERKLADVLTIVGQYHSADCDMTAGECTCEAGQLTDRLRALAEEPTDGTTR